MKITIDDAKYCLRNGGFCSASCKHFPETDCEDNVRKIAIETMNKYQKIKEIVEHWACCGNPSDSMIAISEVLEDGKND